MNPSSNDEANLLFKSKRDQYMIQIRKSKNEMFIETKRQKMMTGAPRYGSVGPQIQNDLETIQRIKELAATFIENMKNEDLQNLILTIQDIRETISRTTNPPLNELISTGIVPHILNFLDYSYFEEVKLLVECGWIICNIASGSIKHVEFLISLGVSQKAINLLDHSSEDVKDNAIWILSNISGDSIPHRDELIDMGIVGKIESVLDGHAFQPLFIGHVSWLISNLCRGSPYPPVEKIAPLMRLVEFFLKNVKHEETVKHAMWALSYFSDGTDEQIQAVIEMGIIDTIIQLTRSDNPEFKAPGLRTAGNLVTGRDDLTECLIEKGIIEVLFENLLNEKKIFRKEACWALSNILAGPSKHIEIVFLFKDQSIIKTLFHLAYNDLFDVARESIYCLANACSNASKNQIQVLFNYGVIDLFVETLKRNQEANVAKSCLEAIENILIVETQMLLGGGIGGEDLGPYKYRLAELGGYAVIESLQTHPDNDVYAIVERLISKHLDYEGKN